VDATNFTGFLYAGLMMTNDGPKALRIQCPSRRPRDTAPDASHAIRLCAGPSSAAEGKLATTRIEWRTDPSVCVVLASGGYPGGYETAKPISGIEDAEASSAVVFHAGNAQSAPRDSRRQADAYLE